MPRLVFTPQLRRFLAVPDLHLPATGLRQALEAAFEAEPRLRSYIVDDQGHLRANVVVFVDGRRCEERVRLDQALAEGSVVHVMQALSGG
jgi:hypothetical protein